MHRTRRTVLASVGLAALQAGCIGLVRNDADDDTGAPAASNGSDTTERAPSGTVEDVNLRPVEERDLSTDTVGGDGTDPFQAFVDTGYRESFATVFRTDSGVVAAGSIGEKETAGPVPISHQFLLTRVDPERNETESAVFEAREAFAPVDAAATPDGFLLFGLGPDGLIAYRFSAFDRATQRWTVPTRRDVSLDPTALRAEVVNGRVVVAWHEYGGAERTHFAYEVKSLDGARVARRRYRSATYRAAFADEGAFYLLPRGKSLSGVVPESAATDDVGQLVRVDLGTGALSPATTVTFSRGERWAFAPVADGYVDVDVVESAMGDSLRWQHYDADGRPSGEPGRARLDGEIVSVVDIEGREGEVAFLVTLRGTESDADRTWLGVVGPDGTIARQRTFRETDTPRIARDLAPSDDGGYLLCGTAGEADGWLVFDG